MLTEESFKGLESLETLNLTNNRLQRISSATFSHLLSLKLLNLSSNSMQEVSSNAFANLANLTTLSLRDNELGRELKYEVSEDEQDDENNGQLIIPDEMKQVLRDSESTVFHLSLSALDVMYLPHVQSIDLGHNVFQAILQSHSPFSTFKRRNRNTSSSATARVTQSAVWTHLKQLSLDGCAIEFLEKGSLDGLISLSILRLNNNSLKVRDRQSDHTHTHSLPLPLSKATCAERLKQEKRRAALTQL